MCKMTVLMTVKNGEKHLRSSIQSVLDQTFDDYEFIIFDDNSNDSTWDILQNYKDERLKIYKGKDYISNLNTGIEISKSDYIARMDHDDIMFPHKLASQYQIMEETDTDVCGTVVYLIGESFGEPYLEEIEKGFVINPLESFSKINFIHHSSVVIRKKFLTQHNLKYENYFPADDYKLWIEIAKRKGKFYMFPQPLLFYRISPQQSGTVLAHESARLTKVLQDEVKDLLKLTTKATTLKTTLS